MYKVSIARTQYFDVIVDADNITDAEDIAIEVVGSYPDDSELPADINVVYSGPA